MKAGDVVKFRDFPGDETFIIIEVHVSRNREASIDLLTVGGEIMHAHNPNAFEMVK